MLTKNSSDYMRIAFMIFFDIIFLSCATDRYSSWDYVREDYYCGTTLNALVKKYGDPEYLIEKLIGYPPPVQMFEPEYLLHFTEIELRETVTIYRAYWHHKKGKYDNMIVWLKQDKGKWIGFMSVEYKDGVAF
ncbi:MAG: hypothetical protein Ta2B_00480 [Termitinemataceae bacterium]|nr:MAG: hypothetical protein Ta2B_00480 [Termitinemataceae bacterium]